MEEIPLMNVKENPPAEQIPMNNVRKSHENIPKVEEKPIKAKENVIPIKEKTKENIIEHQIKPKDEFASPKNTTPQQITQTTPQKKDKTPQKEVKTPQKEDKAPPKQPLPTLPPTKPKDYPEPVNKFKKPENLVTEFKRPVAPKAEKKPPPPPVQQQAKKEPLNPMPVKKIPVDFKEEFLKKNEMRKNLPNFKEKKLEQIKPSDPKPENKVLQPIKMPESKQETKPQQDSVKIIKGIYFILYLFNKCFFISNIQISAPKGKNRKPSRDFK